MNTCNFCGRTDFPSPQSFYAHLKWCPKYPKDKQTRKAASLREAVPKAQPQMSVPVHPLSPPPPSDPMTPFLKVLQGAGLLPSTAEEVQETPPQKRRRLLQAAKGRAIDNHWSFIVTVTAEMRAAAKLTIDRELRNEPLEELPPQEVDELVGGLRDRVYSAFRRRQEKESQRSHETEERKRAAQRDDERTHTACKKKKAALLKEAQRRIVTLVKTRSLSPLERLQVIEEVLTQLDETLSGAESLPEGYAFIDAVLQTRIADWEADDAAQAAKKQEDWIEIGAVVLIIIAGVFIYTKAPGILAWLLNWFSPKPADSAGDPDKPTEPAPSPPSGQTTPVRRIKRIRRRPQPLPPGLQ
jgi:hypothetical protein